jgi:hypothetical protein
MNSADLITPESFLPDIIAKYPATRAVFDRYGLHGCGGPLGPRERVDWFSRLHGVPLKQLLSELNHSASESSVQTVEFSPSIADAIYRPFFLAGILTVLTLGCMWGARSTKKHQSENHNYTQKRFLMSRREAQSSLK